ncbi:unnamed protein product, partial [marine sediment metagenome]
ATLTTSFALQHFIFKTPAAVDSTWTFGISSDTPAVADFYFDLVQFGAMTSFNNMNFALISGATGFGLGDKFGYGSDNVGFKIDEAEPGIIQKFIGRCFATQLPSATSNSETIVDPGVPILTIYEIDRLTIANTLFEPSIPILMVFVTDDLTTTDSITQPLTLYEIHVTDDLTVVSSYTEYYALYEIFVTDDLTVVTSETQYIPILQIFVTDDLTMETSELQYQPVYEISVTDDLTVVTSEIQYQPVYEMSVTDDLTVVTDTT